MSLKLVLKYIISLMIGVFLGNLLYKSSDKDLIMIST